MSSIEDKTRMNAETTPRALPIYKSIKNSIRNQIDRGELAAGARVSSEQQLARELNVSRGQVRQALRDLQRDGYLVRHPGRGSFVTSAEHRRPARPNGSKKTLALAYPRLAQAAGTYHVRTLVEGFASCVSEHGLRPMFYYVDVDLQSDLRFMREVSDSGMGGLALWAYSRTKEECDLVAQICQSSFPCVLIDRYFPEIDSDFVGTANRSAFSHLTNELIARGHRVFGYITRDFADSVMDDRYAGFRRALDQAGLSFSESHLGAFGHRNRTTAPQSAVSAMMADAPRPTAFVCSDGYSAETLVECLGVCGLTVPGDIEIATMDDSDPEERDKAPWLMAVQDGYAIGRNAAEILIDRMNNTAGGYQQRLVQAKLLFTPAAQLPVTP